MVENSTGYLVDTISEGGYTYNYSYDALGNITAYTKKNFATGQVLETAVYRYDDKNQLVFAGTSDTVGTAYTYDANGNILTKTNTATNATVSYGYTDPTWADLLTSYNGQTITYDEVGNPINYRNGMTFGWAMDSRNLETVTIGENVYNYSYTGEGERAAKYVGDVSYQYKFFDGVLYGESRYDSLGETLIYYLYNENGTMYGFSYNGTPYYYRLNLQGDVTGIYDSNGQLVTEYTYDEWGKVLTVTGSMANTVGQANAIRYRGYYYDSETGFYYLQTRYYDPETGRFLNADGFISTGQGILSNNMFAYCGNNPVNNSDATGAFYERTAGGFGGGSGSALLLAQTICEALIGITLATPIAINVIDYTTASLQQEMFRIRSRERAKAKEKTITATPPSSGNTYYHVTTPDNAVAIMTTGIMTGSKWEGGYVYAWKTNPSKYAIENSGARGGVTISFKTSASFVMDKGITDPKIQMMYGPVVSARPGPIVVWDVQIVG